MDTTRPSLLLRIRDRADVGAWRTFDALYRPMLERFARGRGLRPEDAEDVAQHCLTVIADRIGDFSYDPQKGRFKGWLRTLVNNRVRNLLRQRAAGPLSAAELADLGDDAAAPDEAFDRIWLEEHLWHCLRELEGEVEETTFRAYKRHVIEQAGVEEVCRELNISAKNLYTIKWRLTQRVAAKMRELLDGLE